MQLGKKIMSGFIWNSLQEIASRSAGFFIKLLLARLLFPEAFGIIGMATVFIAFVQVFNDMGMNAALVQRKEELLTRSHYYTTFWTGIGWSALMYLLIYFFLAPFVANFYDEPQLLLIFRVISLTILVSPVVSVQRAMLTKDFQFKKLSIIGMVTSIMSGIIAVILAFYNFGVWALVFNVVAPVLLSIPLFFKATSFIPKWSWKREYFFDIFNFGVFTTGSSLLIKITSQVDYLLIGKMVGKGPLGIYTFAFILTEALRGQFVNIFSKVLYPVFSKKQDDIEGVKKYFLELVKISSLVLIPLMFFFIFFTNQIVLGLFGEKWIEAIPIIKIFCVSVMVHTTFLSITPMIRGTGRPKAEMKFQIIKAVVFYIPLIFIGTYYYGIIGAAWGSLAAKILTMFLALSYLKKFFDVKFSEILASISNAFMIGLLPFMILWKFQDQFDWKWLMGFYISLQLLCYPLIANKELKGYKKLIFMYVKKEKI